MTHQTLAKAKELDGIIEANEERILFLKKFTTQEWVDDNAKYASIGNVLDELWDKTDETNRTLWLLAIRDNVSEQIDFLKHEIEMAQKMLIEL